MPASVVMAAVLIVQTVGGDLHIHEGLSADACAQARCVAFYGQSCEDEAAWEKQRAARDEQRRQEYRAKHPEEVAKCERQRPTAAGVYMPCDNYSLGNTIVQFMSPAAPGDIKRAICVPADTKGR